MKSAPWRIGVDIGGTFTDLVMLDSRDGRMRRGQDLAIEDAPITGIEHHQIREGAVSYTHLRAHEM